MRVSVLAHYQTVDVRATTHVSRDIADELVRRMICERISRKLIRMLPPESVFLASRPHRPASNSLPERLGSPELPGLYFEPPKTVLKPNSAAMRAGWDWAKEQDFLQASPDHRSLPAAAVLPTQLSASSPGELPL